MKRTRTHPSHRGTIGTMHRLPLLLLAIVSNVAVASVSASVDSDGRSAGGHRVLAKALKFTGNTAYPYGLCEGDCDFDSDCSPGLMCFQRSGSTSVPNCDSGGDGDLEDVDYCTLPPGATEIGDEGSITDANDGDAEDGGLQLARCQADCDDDDECADGLVCFQREADEPVPNCSGSPRTGWDYCIRPSDFYVEDEMPNDNTEEPTAKPTSKPTLPKAGNVFTYTEDGNETPDELDRCHGDCDKDKSCASGLICYSRNGKSSNEVPGCTGKATGALDYCIDPKDLPPTPEPTKEPTQYPTRRPTKNPTDQPTRAPVVGTAEPTRRPTAKPTRRPTAKQPTAVVADDSFDGPVTAVDDGLEGPSNTNPGNNPGKNPGTNIMDSSADKLYWAYINPFTLSLNFQTVNGRRLRTSRSLQELNGMINEQNLEIVLQSSLANELGQLSPSFSDLDLELDFIEEEKKDGGWITVTYGVTGQAGFVDGSIPSEEEILWATQEAIQEDDIVRDLRRLDDRDLVLSSVMSTDVNFLGLPDTSTGDVTNTGFEPATAPSPSTAEDNLVEILVLVVICLACVTVTVAAVYYVRRRRRSMEFKKLADADSSRDHQMEGKLSDTDDGDAAATPPPKAFSKQEEPPERIIDTPPTPQLTPPLATTSDDKAKKQSSRRAKMLNDSEEQSSAKKQLFVKDTPNMKRSRTDPKPKTPLYSDPIQRSRSRNARSSSNSRNVPDPPTESVQARRTRSAPKQNSRIRGLNGPGTVPDTNTPNTSTGEIGEWSVLGPSDKYMAGQAGHRRIDSGLASLTSVENIDTDYIDTDTDLNNSTENDNTVSSLGDGGSIFGSEGIQMESVLNFDKQKGRSKASAPESDDESYDPYGKGPRYRYRAAAGRSSRSRSSRTSSKKKRAASATTDMAGQVKAFEEHVLGISQAEQDKLPSRLRLNGGK